MAWYSNHRMSKHFRVTSLDDTITITSILQLCTLETFNHLQTFIYFAEVYCMINQIRLLAATQYLFFVDYFNLSKLKSTNHQGKGSDGITSQVAEDNSPCNPTEMTISAQDTANWGFSESSIKTNLTSQVRTVL